MLFSNHLLPAIWAGSRLLWLICLWCVMDWQGFLSHRHMVQKYFSGLGRGFTAPPPRTSHTRSPHWPYPALPLARGTAAWNRRGSLEVGVTLYVKVSRLTELQLNYWERRPSPSASEWFPGRSFYFNNNVNLNGCNPGFGEFEAIRCS